MGGRHSSCKPRAGPQVGRGTLPQAASSQGCWPLRYGARALLSSILGLMLFTPGERRKCPRVFLRNRRDLHPRCPSAALRALVTRRIHEYAPNRLRSVAYHL